LENAVCPNCKTPIFKISFFCYHCGNKVKEPPVSTRIGRQIWIYFVSFFFPPFGLVPGIKYLRQENSQAQKIGFVAILLTILSVIIATAVLLQLITQAQQQIQAQLSLPGY